MIEVSLIGLGLLLALYTLVIEKLEDLRKLRRDKDLGRIDVMNNLKGLAEKQKDKETRDELEILAANINKILRAVGYEFDWGYFVSGCLFALSLLGGIILFFYDSKALSIVLILSLIGAICNFLWIWFKTMISFRKILKGKFDILNN